MDTKTDIQNKNKVLFVTIFDAQWHYSPKNINKDTNLYFLRSIAKLANYKNKF